MRGQCATIGGRNGQQQNEWLPGAAGCEEVVW
jgi:hypothetical protein